MTHRLGVFATTEGWVLADREHRRSYISLLDAIEAARREARTARWRGAEVEIIAQELPGGPLAVVEVVEE